MKRYLLILLVAGSTLYAPPHHQRRGTPPPINTHVQLLNTYVPSRHLRAIILLTGAVIAATDNPLKKKGLECMAEIQNRFDKINEVTGKAYRIEQNMRAWYDSFRSVLQ